MSSSELARREERAQGGIIQFAEEMQAIRDRSLYPGAENDSQTVRAAWKAYCKERWAMGSSVVNETIQALPVFKRLATDAVGRQMPSVSAAARVASLPEKVQDAILTESPKRNAAADKAKAARKVQRKAEAEGREATDDELIAAAAAVTEPPKKKRRKLPESKFIKLLSDALWFAEQAGDYAQANVLSDVENDWAYNRLEKLRIDIDRIAEKVYKPEHVRSWDDEAAALLGGDER
jgi:hypothetical protein